MEGRYLPTELQDSEGNVIYPHTEADVVWMQDGKSVEESVKDKTQVVISESSIPVAQRKKGTLYFFKKGAGSVIKNSNIAMASPAVGYKLIN